MSRVAASLLTAMGLPELVAVDVADYERRAIELAQQRAKLSSLREKAQVNRTTSPVFDAVRFARHLEAAFQEMWNRHARGETPSPFSVRSVT